MKTKVTLLLTFFTSIWCITAQNVNIPDANFKKALLAHGVIITGNNISKIDANNDKEIQVSEAEAYTGEIRVRNKKN